MVVSPVIAGFAGVVTLAKCGVRGSMARDIALTTTTAAVQPGTGGWLAGVILERPPMAE
jgi:hypothetical protein